MKKDKIIQSLENMNDSYITEAAEYYTHPRRKSNALRFALPAACCATAAACALVIGINSVNNGVSAGSENSVGNSNGIGIVYTDTVVSNSLAETSKDEDVKPNDGNEYFAQFQGDGLTFSENFVVSDDYSGGPIVYSFISDSSGNKNDVEFGYLAFLNGVPQLISVNGSEPSEMVLYTQSPDKQEEVTISIIPRLTEELANEETLELEIFDIFNPSYAPTGTYVGFGNAHIGSMFAHITITANSPIEDIEIIDLGTPLTEYDSSVVNNTDSNVVNNIANNAILYLTETKTNSTVIHLPDDATTAEMKLTLTGMEDSLYRVYIYLNHERVKIDGEYDYVDINVSDGNGLSFDFELPGIKNRDIAYAIAVPLTEPYGNYFSNNIVKSSSVLILTESDPAYNV
ncbi:MAG: hypothetical protein J1E39_08790 [Eubacterium sp.]|nr:hypothetical protein [Eubacterium sp.]